MPSNKNYSIREKVIDRLLHKGWHTRQQLEDACNRELEAQGIIPISSRQTIQNDLLAIRRKFHNAIDTRRIGHQTFYRYMDRDFSVFKTDMSSEDYSLLKGVIDVLKRFTGMPQFDWVDRLALRLDISLSRRTDKRVIVGFEDSSANTGIFYFTPIFDAICERTTISIEYKSFFRREPKTFVLSPYYLKEYNNRWFVLGKSPGYERMSIYALDRIVSMVNAGVKYEDTDVDFKAYFERVVGVTVSDREVETIRLWVSPQQMNYLETKPLHGSQRLVSKDETGAVFEFDLIPNYELEQSVLAFGEHAKVLAPESFKALIRARIAKNLSNYD